MGCTLQNMQLIIQAKLSSRVRGEVEIAECAKVGVTIDIKWVINKCLCLYEP